MLIEEKEKSTTERSPEPSHREVHGQRSPAKSDTLDRFPFLTRVPVVAQSCAAWARQDRNSRPGRRASRMSQYVSLGPLPQCDFAYTTIFSRLFERYISFFEPQALGKLVLDYLRTGGC